MWSNKQTQKKQNKALGAGLLKVDNDSSQRVRASQLTSVVVGESDAVASSAATRWDWDWRWMAVTVAIAGLCAGLVVVGVLWRGTQDSLDSTRSEFGTPLAVNATANGDVGALLSQLKDIESQLDSSIENLRAEISTYSANADARITGLLSADEMINSTLVAALADFQLQTGAVLEKLTRGIANLSVNVGGLSTVVASIDAMAPGTVSQRLLNLTNTKVDALSASTTTSLQALNATAASAQAGVVDVRSQLGLKANASVLIAAQTNVSWLQQSVTALQSTLGSMITRATGSVTYDLQSQITTVNAALATKADTTAVNTALVAKADTTTVNTALAAKADTTTVNTALAAKADTTTVNTAVAAKADTATVNTALAAKADTTTVTSVLTISLSASASLEYAFSLTALAVKNLQSGTGGALAPTTFTLTSTVDPIMRFSDYDNEVYNTNSDSYDTRSNHIRFSVSPLTASAFLKRGSKQTDREGSPPTPHASILILTTPGDYNIQLSVAVAGFGIQNTYVLGAGLTTPAPKVVLYATPQRHLSGFRNTCRMPGGGSDNAWAPPWILGVLTFQISSSNVYGGSVTASVRTSDFLSSGAYSLQIGAVLATSADSFDNGQFPCNVGYSIRSASGVSATLAVTKTTPDVVPFGDGVRIGRIQVRVFQPTDTLPTPSSSDEASVANAVSYYMFSATDLGIKAFPDRTAFTFAEPITDDGRTSYYYHMVLSDPTLSDVNNPRYLRGGASPYYKQFTFAVVGGYIKFPFAGTFEVGVWADDGYWMWIGTKLSPSPARDPYWVGSSYRGTVTVVISDMTEFWQSFTVYVFQSGGAAFWRISYRPLGTSEWRDFTSDMIAA